MSYTISGFPLGFTTDSNKLGRLENVSGVIEDGVENCLILCEQV